MDESAPLPVHALPKRRRVGRLLDVVTIAVIALAAFRFLVVPHLGESAGVNRPAPVVELAATDGRFSLAAHRGRLVFLDFWASWCTPCQASLPLVERWAKSHREVDVVAIDAGEPPAQAARFAREFGLAQTAFDPQLQTTKAFGVDGFPTMIVIDAKGRVVAKWPGYNPAIASVMSDAVGRFSGR